MWDFQVTFFDTRHRQQIGNLLMADLLAMPGIEENDLEIPHLRDLAQPADLS